ncbi:MAG: CbbX protein [Acidimicrobiales bacterium]
MTEEPSAEESATPEEASQPLDLTAEVNLRQELADSGIAELLDGFSTELVGLAPVKKQISETASLLLIDRVRARLGLVSERPTLHMSFTGNPGTGKTTVALKMAEILHKLEYLPTSRVISVTRDDLVGEFIGHTAPKTKEVLRRAMGGVLFIDEAYYLHRPENERDYGRESIEILLQVMEDKRSELVVILAGYGEHMGQFFASNPGFRSRIAHHIDFPDYSSEELLTITEKMLTARSYQFSEPAKEAMQDYIERRRQQPLFANARSMRNALDRAILRHANRQVNKGELVTISDLMTLGPEDILSSRVFAENPSEKNPTGDQYSLPSLPASPQ